jgi:hypothetical protein
MGSILLFMLRIRAATVPRGVAGSSWESLKRKENYCGMMRHDGASREKLNH